MRNALHIVRNKKIARNLHKNALTRANNVKETQSMLLKAWAEARGLYERQPCSATPPGQGGITAIDTQHCGVTSVPYKQQQDFMSWHHKLAYLICKMG